MTRRYSGLAARRRAFGYSQERLAHVLGVSVSTTGRWERGESYPNPSMCRRLAQVLRMSAPELYRLLRECADSHDRAAGDGLPAAPAAPDARRPLTARRPEDADTPWQRLAEILRGDRSVDPTTVSLIESRTSDFFRGEESQTARCLLGALETHSASLRSLAGATGDDRLRRRLVTCLGESQALLGWTWFDLRCPAAAERAYRSALASAREVGDGPLTACVLAYWSYLHSGRGDVLGAARRLEHASEVLTSSSATSSWIAARRAEELARLGENTAALTALDTAVDAFDTAAAARSDARAWTAFFTVSRLGGLAVSTYGLLGDPDTHDAGSALLDSLPLTKTKVTALVLADLATAAARGGDFDRVAELARPATERAVQLEASVAVDRLRDLVRVLPVADRGTVGRVRAELIEGLTSVPPAR